MADMFPAGVAVFFRLLDKDQKLTRSVHPNGRNMCIGRYSGHSFVHDDDYIITDQSDKYLGSYPRDFVAAILPLDTVGPASDANN